VILGVLERETSTCDSRQVNRFRVIFANNEDFSFVRCTQRHKKSLTRERSACQCLQTAALLIPRLACWRLVRMCKKATKYEAGKGESDKERERERGRRRLRQTSETTM